MKILPIVSVIAVLTVGCHPLQDQPGNSDEATGQDQCGEERTAYGADWAYGQDWTELQDVKEQMSIELRRGRQLRSGDTPLNSCPGVIEMKLKSLEETIFKLESKMTDIEGKIDTRSCPASFFNVKDQCFKMFMDQSRSWQQAFNKCEKEGLQLPIPKHPVMLRKYIIDNFGDKVVWLGASGDNTQFKWERTGQRISNTSPLWWTRHPGDRVTTHFCLALLSDLDDLKNQPRRPFFANSCNTFGTRRYALCESPGTISTTSTTITGTQSTTSTTAEPTTTITNARPCTTGFFNVGDQCFKFFIDSARTWQSAKSKCQGEGLQQAKPNDPIRLRRYIVNNFGTKIAWLGAKGDNTAFKWNRNGMRIQNSDPLWWKRHPGDKVGTDHCLVLLSDSGDLKNTPNRPFFSNTCDGPDRYALCEAPGIPSTTSKTSQSTTTITGTQSTTSTTAEPTTTITSTISCITGGFKIGNQCFKLFTDSHRTWDSAKAKCQAEGLQQAEPNDPVTLRKYIVDNIGDHVAWLGTKGDNRAFKWNRNGMRILNSDPLWWPRHPGHRVTTSYCLSLLSDSNSMSHFPTRPFFSDTCSASYPYALCEV